MDNFDKNYTAPPVRMDFTKKSDQNPATEEENSQLSMLNDETPKIKEKKVVSAEVVNGVPFNADAMQSFDPSTIIPKKKKEEQNTSSNFLMDSLNAAVDRTKNEISEMHKELEAQMYEDYMKQEEEKDEAESSIRQKTSYDDDLDDLTDNSDSSSEHRMDIDTSYNVPEENDNRTSIGSTSDSTDSFEEKTVRLIKSVSDYNEAEFEKDFSDEDDDDEDEKKRINDQDIADREKKEAEELLNRLKNAAETSNFNKSIFDKVDLRSFSIGKVPIKASSIVVQEEQTLTADWILYETGRCISMSGLSGPELIQLDPNNSTRNRMNTLRDIYKIIYNHVVDSKKPSFEKWMMQTKYHDLDHLYFCLYKATFGSNNFISYQCNDPDCKETFMKNISYDELVRYKDDSVKKRVQELLSMDSNNGIIKYEVDLVQVSNNYVFGMRSPSLYNVAMENAGLSDSLIEKYGDMINVIGYIDSVYIIDYTNKELTPIRLPEPDPNNPVKSATKKIKTLYQILKKLSSDEYYVLRSYVVKSEKKADEDISYFIPEATCPECGKKIPEFSDGMTANGLLFTRHHLGAFASM